jgi:transketolase
VGVKDVFGASGEPEELANLYGLAAPHIVRAAHRAIARKQRISGRRKNFR